MTINDYYTFCFDDIIVSYITIPLFMSTAISNSALTGESPPSSLPLPVIGGVIIAVVVISLLVCAVIAVIVVKKRRSHSNKPVR